MLTEIDILSNGEPEDGVAYGGWPMDEHTAGGFRAKGQIPSKVRSFDGLYGIPYGCYVSKTIENMMMAGRNISATKLAMGSTRVMGTCAVGGEAAGTAAAMAVKSGCTPREFGQRHIQELRQELLKNDCYILGCRNADERDLALSAAVTATSERSGYEAAKVISGVSRTVGEESNLWRSNGVGAEGETLTLSLKEAAPISQVRVTFDPDLSDERCISVSKAFVEKELLGVAPTLVKDYAVEVLKEGEVVWSKEIKDNHQRLVITDLPETVIGDAVKIHVASTNGCEDARIFEVRVYA